MAAVAAGPVRDGSIAVHFIAPFNRDHAALEPDSRPTDMSQDPDIENLGDRITE